MKHLLIVVGCILVMGCGFSEAQSLDRDQNDSNSGSLQAGGQLYSTDDRVAPKKAKFDLVYASFKQIHDDYSVDIMKTLALLIIGIGWFVTSNKSREFFRKTRSVRIWSVFAAVILYLIHAWASISVYRLSQEKMSLLSALEYVEREYFASYRITTASLVLNLVLIAALFGVLIVILLSLKEEPGN